MYDKNPIFEENEELDISDVAQYARYTMAIERTFTQMQRGLAVCYDPKEIALNVMRVATEFYDADWCGIIEVDLELGVFTPFWWYNRELGPMAQTMIGEFEAFEYQRWIDSLKEHEAIIISDIANLLETHPDEYALYQRLKVHNLIAVPFWKGPSGFLVLRNPKRFATYSSCLRMLNYVIVSSLSEYFMIETSKLTLTSPRITNDNDVYISLFGELKIIGPKGVLTETELNAPKVTRVLVYLLLSKRNGVSPREMADAIWPDVDADCVVKNMKGLIYRLQQAFSLISDCRLVESTPSGYKLNPKLNIITDFRLFEQKRTHALNATTVEQKIDLLKRAIDLYCGDLFQSAASEHWIMATSVDYHYKYVALAGELLKTLFDENDYSCVHSYASKVLTYAPHSQGIYYWMIRSMMQMGHSEMARGELRRAQGKLLAEEYEDLLERLKAS
ncbi:MAG: transcriptional regulator [Oscillospiraceae bacterium]|nr:transcriptional regulator [Oscillospiraceae bacterium]